MENEDEHIAICTRRLFELKGRDSVCNCPNCREQRKGEEPESKGENDGR